MCLRSTILLGVALCSMVNSVEITNNGYSNVVVAISEDVPQPSDDGSAMISSIQSLLTATSKALFTATQNRAYLADINIVLPSTWKNPFPGAEVPNRNNSNVPTIKVVNTNSPGDLPLTAHSGKCGVPGNRIELPVKYLEQTTDTETVKAKAMVHEWAKYRYGVFEEHGFPSDSVLPYFYLHPDGYHALTTCNSTYLDGQLLSLQDGSYCSTENGLLLEPDSCRFRPYPQNQASSTSLMAFHFVDSVVSFCDDTNHDRLAPNRQNNLCGGQSVWSVISQSKDFANGNNPPAAANTNTAPKFRVLQLAAKQPVIYVVVDTSYPSAAGSTLATVRSSLRSLVSSMSETSYISFATFKGHDSGPGAYVTELLAPVIVKDNLNVINSTITNIATVTTVFTRDVAAAVRDSALKLNSYGFQQTGGSILYLVSFTRSAFNTSVLELDMVEQYLSSNIKLVAGEFGSGDSGIILSRFTSLIDGIYHYAPQFSTDLFSQINTELLQLLRAPVNLQRNTISRTTLPLNPGSPFDGSFNLGSAFANSTVVSLASPINVAATVTLLSPGGETLTFSSQDTSTNWNILGSTPLVTSYNIPKAEQGTWKYTLTTVCQETCPQDSVTVQVTSGITDMQAVPQINVWTTGDDSGRIDASVTPLNIYTEVVIPAGRVGGLTIFAKLHNRDSGSDYMLPLLDTGKIEPDHSHDGIYSAMFHPPARGTYDISVHVSSGSTEKSTRLLPEDQVSICCGTDSPTTTISNYEAVKSSAVVITVINPSPTSVKPSKITDLSADDAVVMGSKVRVVLTWTAPFETYTEPSNPVSSYQIKYGSNQNELLNNFDTAKDATVVQGSAQPAIPASKQEVTVEAPYTGKSVFFAIKSIGDTGIASDISNLRWSEPSPVVVTVTSTTPDITTAVTSTTGRTTDVTSSQTKTTDHSTSPSTTEQSSSTVKSTESVTTGQPTSFTTGQSSSTVQTSTDVTLTITQSSPVSSTSTYTSSSIVTTRPTEPSSSPASSTSVSSTNPTVSSASPSTTPESTTKASTTEVSSSTVPSSTTVTSTAQESSTSTSSPTTSSSTISSSGSTSATTSSPQSSSTVTSTLTSSSTEAPITTVSQTSTDGTVTSTGSGTSPIGSSTTSVTSDVSTTTISTTTDVTVPTTTKKPIYQTPEFIGGVAAAATVVAALIIGVSVYCICKKRRNKNEISYESGIQIEPAPKPRSVQPALEKPTPVKEPRTVTAKVDEPLKTVTVVANPSSIKEYETKSTKQSADMEDYSYDNGTFEDDDGLIMTAL